MSTNQPGKPRIKFIDEAGDESTEANAVRPKGVDEADTDSTEAHSARFKGIDEAGDDEGTEGHAIRPRL